MLISNLYPLQNAHPLTVLMFGGGFNFDGENNIRYVSTSYTFEPRHVISNNVVFFFSFFLYILPDPLSSIIGMCTLYTPGCRMKAHK